MKNKQRYAVSMVVRYLLLALCLFASCGISANEMAVKGVSANKVLQLAQAGSCAEGCEAAKKRCMAQYTRTNMDGVKLVTPEGAKICWAAYRSCTANCK